MDSKKEKRGFWLKKHGVMTPGGDPLWYCSWCMQGEHLYGVECSENHKEVCPDCGSKNQYDYRS